MRAHKSGGKGIKYKKNYSPTIGSRQLINLFVDSFTYMNITQDTSEIMKGIMFEFDLIFYTELNGMKFFEIVPAK